MSESTESPAATVTNSSTNIADEQQSGSTKLLSEIRAAIVSFVSVGGYEDVSGGDAVQFKAPGDEFYREISVSLVGDIANPIIEVEYTGQDGSPYAAAAKTVSFISVKEGENFAWKTNEYRTPPKPIRGLSSTPTNRIGLIIALSMPHSFVQG